MCASFQSNSCPSPSLRAQRFSPRVQGARPTDLVAPNYRPGPQLLLWCPQPPALQAALQIPAAGESVNARASCQCLPAAQQHSQLPSALTLGCSQPQALAKVRSVGPHLCAAASWCLG